VKPLAVALALSLGLPSAAAAALRRKEDKAAGIVFRLKGKHLTMKLREQGNPRTVKKVIGKQLTAACGTNADRGGTIVDATITWPEGRSSVAVDFARDISGRVAYCVLEHDATDIAVVRFR
jgi:hypothetical protein